MFGQLWVAAPDELVLVADAEDVVVTAVPTAGAAELVVTAGEAVVFVLALGDAEAPAMPAAPPAASAPTTRPAVSILRDIGTSFEVLPGDATFVDRPAGA